MPGIKIQLRTVINQRQSQVFEEIASRTRRELSETRLQRTVARSDAVHANVRAISNHRQKDK
ncbi:hypothetical protein DPMN_140492 [Dreissena polymorpha]|uniref:Uncharacterized protein n=1 Tax=Dreissena polymorpha TaxID=45954 RepID=A0A9D4GBM8_DREPO|nr:hypothetical protein DPMN_140492 [Dreissena polymorpha]